MSDYGEDTAPALAGTEWHDFVLGLHHELSRMPQSFIITACELDYHTPAGATNGHWEGTSAHDELIVDFTSWTDAASVQRVLARHWWRFHQSPASAKRELRAMQPRLGHLQRAPSPHIAVLPYDAVLERLDLRRVLPQYGQPITTLSSANAPDDELRADAYAALESARIWVHELARLYADLATRRSAPS